MKKLVKLGVVIFLFTSFLKVNAQEFIPEENLTKTNFGFYAGGQASTNGLGLNATFILNKRFSFRAGFETLKLNTNFNFDENDISYDADLDYKTGALFFLADFYYTSRLYLSAGVGTNSFNPKVTGTAVSDLQYGDITIPSSKIGDFIITLEPSQKISPYLGAGVRSFIGKNKRLIFNFETGLYYLGPPNVNIEATGLLAPTADPAHGQKENLEKQIEQYKFYPVVKLSLAVKLF